jgi:hypothetical protein
LMTPATTSIARATRWMVLTRGVADSTWDIIPHFDVFVI